ncbi:ATP-binding protein [Kitasatospora sp. NPDC091207]|uniref:ATP-binding protein n=1 Tax=Kitasatospora sp. NPDC091207 TaxID=3364083 RepID=UPI00381537D4
MTGPAESGGAVHNTITGGTFFGTVVQARNVTAPPRIVPALAGLPAPSRTFAGRQDQLDSLLACLDPGWSASAAVVCAVSGMPGVGKTELVLQVAARARAQSGWFPGGVLFCDLHGGTDGGRESPERVLHGFLHALGVSPETIPEGLEERSRLWATVLANYADQGLRVLVVLDNASSARQVKPLLPSDGTTAALVTSRHRLSDLGAQLLDLDVLEAAGSLELLRDALQQARGDADTRMDDGPEEATRIAELCGHLPLALRIVASLLADDPGRALASTVEDLTDARSRLDELEREDLGVRAAFDLSLGRLTPDQAQLFRLLPLTPGPRISLGAAAALADIDGRTARRRLAALARAHLVERSGERLWRMHDLVRLYALEQGHGVPSSDALDRLRAYYVQGAEAAHADIGAPGSDSHGWRIFAAPEQAGAWMDEELPGLIAATTGEPAIGRPDFGLYLATLLAPVFHERRLLEDWLTTAESALRCSHEIDDPGMAAAASINLGVALSEGRQFRRAAEMYQRAADGFRRAGDKSGEGMALSGVGSSLGAMAEYTSALPPLRRAVKVLRRTPERQVLGLALSNLGRAWGGAGKFDVAVRTARQAVAVFREVGDRHGEGEALQALGTVLHRADRGGDECLDVLRQAIEAFHETGDSRLEGVARSYLDLIGAEAAHEGGLPFSLPEVGAELPEGGSHSMSGDVLLRRGAVLLRAGHARQAAESLREAVDMSGETGPRLGEGDASALLGMSLIIDPGSRSPDEAVSALEAAVAIFRELGERQRETMALGGIQLIQGLRHLEKRELDEAFGVLLEVISARPDPDRDGVRSWWHRLRRGGR